MLQLEAYFYGFVVKFFMVANRKHSVLASQNQKKSAVTVLTNTMTF